MTRNKVSFAAFACGLVVVGAAHAAADQSVLTAVKACEPDARALLERLVQIDSGTGDAAGIAAVEAALKPELERAGARVEIVRAEPPAVGDNLVATVTGSGRGKILLIAHIDTVFPHGTVAQRPYRVTDDLAYGPGAGDDKQGSVAAVCALRALEAIRFTDFARITLIVNSSEETGSFGARALIREHAKASDVAINLERGVPPDALLLSRKGAALVTLEITGRAAHSGLEPEKGRNAVIEAAHQALELGKLADPGRKTTVNVTVLQGGGAFNVIPEHAVLKADVRFAVPEELERVARGVADLAAATIVPAVRVKASIEKTFPAWPRVASTDALLARAQKVYAEIDRRLTGVEVGSSADVALAAETGTPSIDGFGLLGDGAHGPDDHADLASFTPRVYLLTRMLMELGRDPPPKPAAARSN